MRSLILPLLVMGLGAEAARADTALIIANDRYESAQNLRTADDFEDLRRPFRRAGFDVTLLENADADDIRDELAALVTNHSSGRIVIAFAGHVVQGRTDSWLVGVDAADDMNIGDVGNEAVSLTLVMEIAARAPGQAVVLLGTEDRRIGTGPGLRAGATIMDVPQGVLVVDGPPRDLIAFARSVLLEEGGDVAAGLAASGDLRGHGFVTSVVPFTPPASGAVPPPPAPPAPPAPEPEPEPDAAERALWNAATELDTIPAYQAYLDRYADGFFADQAADRISALDSAPDREAERIEEALGLSRDDRRAIQRNLTVLGFDTRGIDGIFGSGTRAAIAGWQAATSRPETGFLDRRQIAALERQGDRRRAEIEAEEAAARAAEEAADRAWWRATGEGRDETALRAYLDRYPSGLFAASAREQLDAIVAGRDRAAWDRARDIDTVRAYRTYLDEWPEGRFAEEAERIIDDRRGGGRLSPAERAQAEAREAALNISPVARSLIESRLAGLGLDPGPVDGVFDADTRRAIRQYQRARGLPVTGYVERGMVVRLMAEVLGARIIE